MKKGLKIVLIGTALFVVIFSAIGYYASTQINPEKIRKMTIETIESALPGAEVGLGKIDYSLGLSVKLEVDKFEMKVRRGGSPLVNLSQLKVKLPIWSILTGGGTVGVEIEAPKFFMTKIHGDQSNWDMALGSKKKEVDTSKKDSANVSFEIPSFLEESKINIRIKDLEFLLREGSEQATTVNLKKILVKNLNLKSSSAFEIESKIGHQLGGKNVGAEIQLIGEVDLGAYLRTQNLNSSFVLKVKNILYPIEGITLPSAQNSGKILLRPDGSLSLDNELKVGSFLVLKSKVSLTDKNLKVSGIDGIFSLQRATEVLQNSPEILGKVNLDNSDVKLNGSVDLNLESKTLDTDLSFETTKAIDISKIVQEDANIALKGNFVRNKASLKSTVQIFDGVITTDVETVVDPMNLPDQIWKYNEIKVNTLITGLRFSEDYLKKAIYSKADAKAQEAPAEQVELGEDILLPKTMVNIEGKNLFIGSKEFALAGKVFAHKSDVNVKDLSFKQAGGSAVINSEIKLEKVITGNFNTVLKKFNLDGFSAALPSYVGSAKGISEGKIIGNFSKGIEMSYSANGDVSLKNGVIKNFKVKEMIAGMFESLKDKLPKQDANVSDGFDLLQIKFDLNNTKTDLKKLLVIGENNSFDVNLMGKIGMLENMDSVLTGTVRSEEITKSLQINKLGVRFKGKQFFLLPDIDYILKDIGKQKIAAESTKAKEQAKKQAKREVKKLENQLKKKLKIPGLKL